MSIYYIFTGHKSYQNINSLDLFTDVHESYQNRDSGFLAHDNQITNLGVTMPNVLSFSTTWDIIETVDG